MRVRTLLLALALASTILKGPALAERAANPEGSGETTSQTTPRIAVSAIMSDSGQALVWDANQGEYVVVKVGSLIQGFRVRAIFPEQVVIEGNQPGESFIFALAPRDQINRDLGNHKRTPPSPYAGNPHGPIDPYGPSKIVSPKGPLSTTLAPSGSRSGDELRAAPMDPYGGPAIPKVKAPEASAPTSKPGKPIKPIDPYGPPAKTGPTPASAPMDPYGASNGPAGPVDPYGAAKSAPKPVDPYASPPPIRKVVAPEASRSRSGSGSVAATAAAAAASAAAKGKTEDDSPVAPSSPLDPYASMPRVPTTVVGGVVGGAKPRTKTIRLSRSRFNGALSDFSRLAREVKLEEASGGGFRVASVKRRSYFYRIGFRRGDVIREVAGVKLRSVDDAATVYAEIASRKSFVVHLERSGRPLVVTYKFR